MLVKIKINWDNDELWCCVDKERISIGDEYAEVIEDYLGQEIVKIYRKENLPVDEDSYYEE